MTEIKNLNIIFVRNTEPEIFFMPTNSSFSYAPVVELNKPIYNTVNFQKKDKMTYIKLRYSDFWLYKDEKDNLIFSKLKRNPTLFSTYQQPLPFWIDYISKNAFILYEMPSILKEEAKFVKYENNQLSFTDENNATKFIFDIVSEAKYPIIDDVYPESSYVPPKTIQTASSLNIINQNSLSQFTRLAK